MSRTRKPVNPSAQKGLDRLKEETAAELGLNDYKNTYKGALTSADNGRVGGHMVRKMIEARETQFGQGNTQATGSTLTAKQDINKKS
jgi:small acid-soluble spore protein D (minor alpha/beta-type SASP)